MEARQIELLEQVVDDMVNVLKSNHLERLRNGACGVFNGSEFFNLLSEAERISDACSNVGVATVARTIPEIHHQIHDYISRLHSGRDEEFNQVYQQAHDEYTYAPDKDWFSAASANRSDYVFLDLDESCNITAVKAKSR